MNARQNRRVLTDPNVIADNGIAFVRHVGLWRNGHLPTFENVERKRRSGIHLMIGTVHDEIYAGGDLAKLTDNQLISAKIIMVRDVFLEIRITEVRKVADDNVRIFDLWLDVRNGFAVRHGE